MTDNSTFRDLALALTEEERRTLHKRISSSLSLRADRTAGAITSGSSSGKRGEIIAKEMSEMPFWRRIRLFLRRLFSAHGDEQTYIEFRLSELRRRAKSALPQLAPLEHHTVEPAIATVAWDLYREVYSVIPFFLDLWRGGDYLQECIGYLLSQRIPTARGSLDELATMSELQGAFLEHELKGDVRRFVVDRLDSYVDGVPKELFGKLADGLQPLYYLKQLALFDYNVFFSTFGFDPGIAPPEEAPPFKATPASAALPAIELLYYALHTAAKLPADFYVHTEVLDRYLEIKERERLHESVADEPGAPAEVNAEQHAYEVRKGHIEELRTGIQRLSEAGRALAKRVPFADVIRYYAHDPWLRIAPYVPEIRLKEFYRSYLMIRVLSELDSRFAQIRRGVIDRMVRKLFGGEPPAMAFFRTGVQLVSDKVGGGDFTHIRSLTLSHGFLRFLYRGRMQEMMRTLGRVLPVRQRDSSSDLVVHVAGMDEAFADIEDFDESFSPDTDDGKAFFRIRYGVEKDASLLRTYRNIVTQRDREAGVLVDRTSEHARGLMKVMDSIRSGLTDQLRERYAASDRRVNEIDGIDRLLENHRAKLDEFDRLIRQVRAMEEGY